MEYTVSEYSSVDGPTRWRCIRGFKIHLTRLTLTGSDTSPVAKSTHIYVNPFLQTNAYINRNKVHRWWQ